MAKKLETITNLAMLTICILVGTKLFFSADSVLTSQKKSSPAPPDYSLDDVLPPLPGVSYAENQRTVLLVLRSTCPFCKDSVPFYQTLIDERNRRNAEVRIVAALETEDAGQSFLGEHDLAVDYLLVGGQISALKISSVPTLIIADDQGRVTGFWRGRLNGDEEEKILSTLLQ